MDPELKKQVKFRNNNNNNSLYNNLMEYYSFA